ncbi:MAG: hypothetical protein AB7H77_04310, partial [Bdellovibrionales bacterium]
MIQNYPQYRYFRSNDKQSLQVTLQRAPKSAGGISVQYWCDDEGALYAKEDNRDGIPVHRLTGWWDGLGTGPEHSQSYRQFVRTGDFTFQCIVVGKTGEEKHTLLLPNTETAIL